MTLRKREGETPTATRKEDGLFHGGMSELKCGEARRCVKSRKQKRDLCCKTGTDEEEAKGRGRTTDVGGRKRRMRSGLSSTVRDGVGSASRRRSMTVVVQGLRNNIERG